MSLHTIIAESTGPGEDEEAFQDTYFRVYDYISTTSALRYLDGKVA